MLTTLHGHDADHVQVCSNTGDVRVTVPSTADGLPDGPLTKSEVHDALVKAKSKAEDFIAAVEGDIEATE